LGFLLGLFDLLRRRGLHLLRLLGGRSGVGDSVHAIALALLRGGEVAHCVRIVDLVRPSSRLGAKMLVRWRRQDAKEKSWRWLRSTAIARLADKKKKVPTPPPASERTDMRAAPHIKLYWCEWDATWSVQPGSVH